MRRKTWMAGTQPGHDGNGGDAGSYRSSTVLISTRLERALRA